MIEHHAFDHLRFLKVQAAAAAIGKFGYRISVLIGVRVSPKTWSISLRLKEAGAPSRKDCMKMSKLMSLACSDAGPDLAGLRNHDGRAQMLDPILG